MRILKFMKYLQLRGETNLGEKVDLLHGFPSIHHRRDLKVSRSLLRWKPLLSDI
ncbi:21087_t:CDS:2 [Rhizophagus irregularis]|nr:21087_t:CDS:2 [Rhizophagus irregularis]